MKETIRDGRMTMVKEPTWSANRFIEEEANTLWLQLPEVFRQIGIEELRAGNTVSTLFRSRDGRIAFVEFAHEPRAIPPQSGVIIYGEEEAFRNGFDDTKCAYKDPVSGEFLSFYKDAPERGTA